MDYRLHFGFNNISDMIKDRNLLIANKLGWVYVPYNWDEDQNIPPGWHTENPHNNQKITTFYCRTNRDLPFYNKSREYCFKVLGMEGKNYHISKTRSQLIINGISIKAHENEKMMWYFMLLKLLNITSYDVI